MSFSLHESHSESTPPVNATQFALVPIGRRVHLLWHYEVMKVDAETLPPAPHRPPLAYAEATLAELRRELLDQAGEGVAA